MSDFILPVLSGDSRVQAVLDSLPDEVRAELLKEIGELTGELYSTVQTEAESAFVSRTGKTLADLRQKVYDDPDSIRGRVFSLGGAKVVALEYGAHGTGTVKAHSQRLTHIFGDPVSDLYVEIPEHSRTQNIAAHSFMRPALAAMSDRAVEQMQAAIDRALARAQEELA